MKTLGLAATLMLLGTLTLSMADTTVDEQIAAIAAATPEERVALVNGFKETLSTMNNNERAAAIAQMRSSMSSTGEQMQTQTQTRLKSRMGQMEQTDEMQRMQQMNQQQTGSQAMQQGNIGAGMGAAGTPNKFMGMK